MKPCPWGAGEPGEPSKGPSASSSVPSYTSTSTLRDAVQLGYYRGILQALDAIDAAHPDSAPFARAMRTLARQFQFESIAREIARPDTIALKDTP